MLLSSNPILQFRSYEKEIVRSINQTLHDGSYINGPQVSKFEESFAKYCNVKYAIGVNSGTDALFLSLKALSIGKGDEVITVSHTAIATISAIISAGAKPVLIDIDKDFYNLDHNIIEKVITKKTKAIIPVHLYGQSCDMNNILKIAKKYNLKVIEDCAQSPGAEYFGKKLGSLGTIGAFSFYPTKNLGAIGDGGIIITNNKFLAKKLKKLRQFGWDQNRKTTEIGFSSRLDEIQAAILNIKLQYLDSDNLKRINLSKRYEFLLNSNQYKLPKVRNNTKHVFHLYVLKVQNRDKLIEYLKKQNIYCGIHYKLPTHLHKGYHEYCKIPYKLNNTTHLCNRILSLPMYPELKFNEVEIVCKNINNFISN